MNRLELALVIGLALPPSLSAQVPVAEHQPVFVPSSLDPDDVTAYVGEALKRFHGGGPRIGLGFVGFPDGRTSYLELGNGLAAERRADRLAPFCSAVLEEMARDGASFVLLVSAPEKSGAGTQVLEADLVTRGQRSLHYTFPIEVQGGTHVLGRPVRCFSDVPPLEVHGSSAP